MAMPERQIGNSKALSKGELGLLPEDPKYTVVKYQELKVPEDKSVMLPPEEWALVKDHLSLLREDSNISHFTGIVKKKGEIYEAMTTEEFIDDIRNPKVHFLNFRNARDEVVGYAIIRDPEEGQHDGWLEKLVVRNNFQSKKKGESRHVGSQVLDKVKEFVFKTKTWDGRERQALHTALVMFVPNWERTDRLFSRNGFHPIMRIPQNAEVIVKDRESGKKKFEKRDVTRFMFSRQSWNDEKRRPKFHKSS